MKGSTDHAAPGDGVERPRPFETLRYDPAEGFVRLERHLARWRRSCAWLGMPAETEAVLAALRRACEPLSTPHRVRVTLTFGGEVEVTTSPLPMSRFNDTPSAAVQAADAVVASGGHLPRAAVARQRVDETDPARSHKTTSRDLYYAGRRLAKSAALEDVIFLDSRGLVSEGSIASVFVVNREAEELRVATPPLSSGALPGVLREELLDLGLVEERAVTEVELRGAQFVLVGSSVRGLRRVALDEDPVDVV